MFTCQFSVRSFSLICVKLLWRNDNRKFVLKQYSESRKTISWEQIQFDGVYTTYPDVVIDSYMVKKRWSKQYGRCVTTSLLPKS